MRYSQFVNELCPSIWYHTNKENKNACAQNFEQKSCYNKSVNSKGGIVMKELRHAELSKKECSLFIVLDYLRNHTSENKPLTLEIMCREIEELYGLEMVRNTLTSKLRQLKKIGYVAEPKNNYVLTEKEFSDTELRVLIDSLVYTNALSEDSAEELIDKLMYFANDSLRREKKQIKRRMNNYSRKNGRDIIGSYEYVTEAIRKRKKLLLNVKVLDSYFNMVRKYPESVLVSPYELVISNNRYVLICAVDGDETLSEFYLDRITNMSDTNENIRPIDEIQGFEKRGALEEYIKSSPTLGGGMLKTFTVKCDNEVLCDFAESLGCEFRKYSASEENDIYNTVIRVNTTANNLKLAMLPYIDSVTVLNDKQFNNELTNIFEKSKHNIHISGRDISTKIRLANDLEEAVRLIESSNSSEIYFHGQGGSYDISALKRVPHITSMTLLHTDLGSGEILEELKELKKLKLIDCKFDFDHVLNCQKLRNLAISDLTQQQADKLTAFKELETLELSYNVNDRNETPAQELKNIDFVKGLPRLRRIDICNCIAITDYSPLTELPCLRTVNIRCKGLPEDTEEKLRGMLPKCKIFMQT
jgi:hypothetical protein